MSRSTLSVSVVVPCNKGLWCPYVGPHGQRFTPKALGYLSKGDGPLGLTEHIWRGGLARAKPQILPFSTPFQGFCFLSPACYCWSVSLLPDYCPSGESNVLLGEEPGSYCWLSFTSDEACIKRYEGIRDESNTQFQQFPLKEHRNAISTPRFRTYSKLSIPI